LIVSAQGLLMHGLCESAETIRACTHGGRGAVHHARPFQGHPKVVLGAIGMFCRFLAKNANVPPSFENDL